MKQQEQYHERYHRQLILKGFGDAAQQRLSAAKVLVVGAGGLGCPVLQYLAAAGVGHIGIVDDDVVSLNNLHRQVLYNVQMIGQPKAICAANVLQQLNPNITCTIHHERLTNHNAASIMSGYDIVIDGTDNFASRYLINDACVLLQKPLIFGAIAQYEGQVAVFNVSLNNTPATNYRDLFPLPPKPGEVLNCAEAGVLGVLPAIIGGFMANEAIKLIAGIGHTFSNQLLTYNALINQTYEINISPQPATRNLIPATLHALMQTDYDSFCNATVAIEEIDAAQFNDLLHNDAISIVDVREKDEWPVVTQFSHLHIPLAQLMQHTAWLTEPTIVIFCISGIRSVQAALQLTNHFGSAKKILSVKGGIQAWMQLQTQAIS